MTAIPLTRPHTAALRSVLAATNVAIAPNEEGGRKPAGAGWQGPPGQSVFVPYFELHPIPGGTLDGSLGCPDDDLSAIWQVTAVGGDQEQCELIADLARTTLLSAPITVEGRAVLRSRVEVLGGVRRDDSVETPVWISTDRFRFSTTPA